MLASGDPKMNKIVQDAIRVAEKIENALEAQKGKQLSLSGVGGG